MYWQSRTERNCCSRWNCMSNSGRAEMAFRTRICWWPSASACSLLADFRWRPVFAHLPRVLRRILHLVGA
eukprot:4943413-Pyramimonas_sp.AAC.1